MIGCLLALMVYSLLEVVSAQFTTVATTGDAATGIGKYLGAGVVGTKVYFVPCYQNNVGMFDTGTNAFSTVATTGDAATAIDKYSSGAAVVDTQVHFAPVMQNNVGIFDTGTSWAPC